MQARAASIIRLDRALEVLPPTLEDAVPVGVVEFEVERTTGVGAGADVVVTEVAGAAVVATPAGAVVVAVPAGAAVVVAVDAGALVGVVADAVGAGATGFEVVSMDEPGATADI